jgi:hypothetical protein
MYLQKIESKIYTIRGIKVMLDFDLALLYEVETKNLNLAVKRNIKRFPEDFRFKLNDEEWKALRLQFETSNKRGGTRYNPYAFTEQGLAMLSGVLNSQKAIDVNIAIMRTFVHLRHYSLTHNELDKRITDLERKYDGNFSLVFDALRRLIQKENKPLKKIGFKNYE